MQLSVFFADGISALFFNFLFFLRYQEVLCQRS